MATPKEQYYEKRAEILIRNLKKRHFDAYYCATRAEAREQALHLIPAGASVGWGGALSAEQIGLMDAVRNGDYRALDREHCQTAAEREALSRACLDADVFLTGANGLSLTGEMVNIDGTGNRVAAIIYGPKRVLVIAGMNKVADTLEEAVRRARTVAAPINKQRFPNAATPCIATGVCGDCHADGCICNQIVITRNCRPDGRICFLLVGEDLGM